MKQQEKNECSFADKMNNWVDVTGTFSIFT
jgi:hypothetical protein